MKNYTKQITAIAVLSLFASAANAQTDTYQDTIDELNALAIGDLPTEITGVVADINGYLEFESGKNTTLLFDVATLEGIVVTAEGQVTLEEADVTQFETDATNKQTEITTAIAADPTDTNIPVLQAELAVIQGNIVTAEAEVAAAEGLVTTAEQNVTAANTAVQNSDIKIALYNSVLVPETGTISLAQAAADAAAQTIEDAITDYSTVNSTPAGLEGVITEIEGVTAGDPTTVTTAIVNANTTFQGITPDAASVGDIQALIIAIDTNLPNLPPITAADQADAIGEVTSGAYERVAIADNAAGVVDNATAVTDLVNGAVTTNTNNITTLNGDDTVAGSVDSKVAANSTADQAYTDDLANGAVTTNTNNITTLNGDDTVAGSVDSKVAANSTADQAYTDDLANGAVTTNTNNITTLNGDDTVAGSVDSKVAANSTADQAYTDDLANGAVKTNTNNITTLNGDDTVAGSVDSKIAGAMTGVSANGVDGVIKRNGNNIIELGANTFFFNDVTDTISTTSGDINLDADVDITGDLTIAGLTGDVASRINSNSSAIASNKDDIEQNSRGIAMVAALQHTTVLPGMTNAFDLSAAHFEGETGLALNFARRINENVQINFGAASTTDFDESVIKAGIGVQW